MCRGLICLLCCMFVPCTSVRQFCPTDQREGLAQQYLDTTAGQEKEPLQLAGEAPLQNRSGHDPDVPNQSSRLGQNNNVEFTSAHIAEADFEWHWETNECAAMADSGLRMIRFLKWGTSKENAKPETPEKTRRIEAATESEEGKVASKLNQKWSQENGEQKEIQDEISELKREKMLFEEGGIGNLPIAQLHRRRSRADSKIALIQHGRRGDRGKRAALQAEHSPNESSNSAVPINIPGPADGGYPAAIHPQNQQLLPKIRADCTVPLKTKFQSASQFQPNRTLAAPSSPSLVAICHNCNVRITEFPGAPYNLPTSCPNCHCPLTYRPFEEKTTSRFRHLPLDQRPAARTALKSSVGIDPRMSTRSALKISAGEPKQVDGPSRKRRWTAREKEPAKLAKGDRRREWGGNSSGACRFGSSRGRGRCGVYQRVTRYELD